MCHTPRLGSVAVTKFCNLDARVRYCFPVLFMDMMLRSDEMPNLDTWVSYLRLCSVYDVYDPDAGVNCWDKVLLMMFWPRCRSQVL